MELRQNLDAWTYETVVAAVCHFEYEPARLDFKEVFQATDKKQQKWHTENIQKCVASMANAPEGGYVLFGIRDPRADGGGSTLPPESRIVGMPLGVDFRKELGEKLRAIQPCPLFELKVIPLPADPARGVLVVEIPASPLRPHMDPSTHVFFKRGWGGSAEPMDQHEVRDQMLYSAQRLQQVKMLRLELHAYRLLRAALRDPNTWFVRFDAQAFKVLLAQTCDLLPSDGELLAQLQGIATMAGQFNSILERSEALWRRARFIPAAMPGNPKVGLDASVQQQLDAFDEWCAQAQGTLTVLFGPLPVTNALWPGTR